MLQRTAKKVSWRGVEGVDVRGVDVRNVGIEMKGMGRYRASWTGALVVGGRGARGDDDGYTRYTPRGATTKLTHS